MRSTAIVPPLFALFALSSVPATAGNGADEAPTFNRDVAPIVFEHCAGCHRPGAVAPMSLLSYEQARPWAKSIAHEVADRSMPPWHADSTRVAYANDRRLSQAEIDTVVAWVGAGAPAGDPADLPPTPEFPETWLLGEPDLVFTTNDSFTIPVTEGEIPYQSRVFAVDIPDDLYVAAWEILPDRRDAVHHANLVRSPASLEGKSVGIASAVMAGGDYIGSYLPGHSAVAYPEGMAYKLPAGSHLGIQVHYVSVGEEVQDRIHFGIHLAEGRVDKLVRVVGTDYRDIEIPPGEAHYEVVDEISLLFDTLALTSGAHMHLRGAAYRMEAVRPDGSVELVTDVPRYDFNWQSNYELAHPVFMPKGTKLRVTSVWDNSAGNPLNPDPQAWVHYGPWTDDEMINSWSHVVLAQEHLGLRIESGRVAGRFDDAIDTPHPFLIQTLPAAPAFQRNADEIRAHEND